MFLYLGKFYELYVCYVVSSVLWGFIEVGELVFEVVGEGLLVDFIEECLWEEFKDMCVLYFLM